MTSIKYLLCPMPGALRRVVGGRDGHVMSVKVPRNRPDAIIDLGYRAKGIAGPVVSLRIIKPGPYCFPTMLTWAR